MPQSNLQHFMCNAFWLACFFLLYSLSHLFFFPPFILTVFIGIFVAYVGVVWESVFFFSCVCVCVPTISFILVVQLCYLCAFVSVCVCEFSICIWSTKKPTIVNKYDKCGFLVQAFSSSYNLNCACVKISFQPNQLKMLIFQYVDDILARA